MADTRNDIRPDRRLAAQRRWNNRCAVCGDHRMQIHHINGCNWDSGRVANLMPLCANCHLEDVEWAHGMPDWQAIDLSQRLCLMQRTQNPFVVDYRFTPLWQRLKVLRMLAPSWIECKPEKPTQAFSRINGAKENRFNRIAEIFEKDSKKFFKSRSADAISTYEMRDLRAHIATFQRGHFYEARVRSALIYTDTNWNRWDPSKSTQPSKAWLRMEPDAMFNDIETNHGKRRRMVEDLVSEMLFYQGWDRPKSLNSLVV